MGKTRWDLLRERGELLSGAIPMISSEGFIPAITAKSDGDMIASLLGENRCRIGRGRSPRKVHRNGRRGPEKLVTYACTRKM